MNLSLPNQSRWGKVFLSWDREHHADFVKQLHAKLTVIGVELVSDSTYDHFLAEEAINDSPVKFFTLVLMTEDYVRSGDCVTEFLKLQVKDLLWTIFYFNSHETDENYHRCRRYAELAGAAINIPESSRLELDGPDDVNGIIAPYSALMGSFCGGLSVTLQPNKYHHDIKKNESAFIQIDVYQMLQAMNPMVEVPFLRTIYRTLTGFEGHSDTDTDDSYSDVEDIDAIEGDAIVYLGVMGTSSCDRENMKLIAKTLSPRHAGLLPATALFKYVEINDSVVPGNRLHSWGVGLIRTLLGNTSSDTYQQLRNDISNSKNDYLLVIDNLGYYDQLKELAKVFDFASPCSKIVFTTINQDFFPKHVEWNKVLDDDSQLRLFSFKGKISKLNVQVQAGESSSIPRKSKRELYCCPKTGEWMTGEDLLRREKAEKKHEGKTQWEHKKPGNSKKQ